MLRRMSMITAALAFLLGLPAQAGDGEVAVELMKLTVSGSPDVTEGRTVQVGDIVTYEFPSPDLPLALNFKLTWITTALPGSLPQPLKVTLLSQTGRTVVSATGRSPFTVSGQINAGGADFKLQVKNVGTMAISALKVAIGGRQGTPPAIDLSNKTPVGGASPSPEP